jgi:hypothetical protein
MRRSLACPLLLGGLIACGLTAGPVQPKNPPPFNDHAPSQKAPDHAKPGPPVFLFSHSDNDANDQHWTAAHKDRQHPPVARDPNHHSSLHDIAAVPEPSTYILLGGGMIALSLLRRKRRLDV